MEDSFICNKNKVLLIKSEEDKVIFARKDAIGIPASELRKAASMSVCKINIDSDARLAMTAIVRKVLKDKPFYNKLENRFMKMFSNSEEVKVIKKEFKKNKGIIDILVNTGGGMYPYHIFKYKIEKVELI